MQESIDKTMMELEKKMNKELFKYRSPQRGIEIIETGRIYLSPPEKFEDLDDCMFGPFSEVDENVVIEKMLSILTTKPYYRDICIKRGYFRGSPSAWRVKIKKILAGKNEYDPCLGNIVMELIPRIINGLKVFDPKTYAWSTRRFLKVLCLCKCYDNIHLWEKYGSNHTGVAIGLSLACIENIPDCKIYDVIYSEQKPSYAFGNMTPSDAVKILTTKGKLWEEEKETRVIFQSHYINFIDASSLISSITFGDKFTLSSELKEMCKRKYPHSKLYKAKLTDGAEIIREPIEEKTVGTTAMDR